jgi:hypothetical protein
MSYGYQQFLCKAKYLDLIAYQMQTVCQGLIFEIQDGWARNGKQKLRHTKEENLSVQGHFQNKLVSV